MDNIKQTFMSLMVLEVTLDKFMLALLVHK